LQIVARDTTNLTPDQLEEFEAVFLHFDRERNNSLKMEEFGAALASLGMNYEQDEMEQCFFDVSRGKGCVNFEQFIGFMVRPRLGPGLCIGGLGGG
jgi:Ca2+-binding EF-hand superfamily protein